MSGPWPVSRPTRTAYAPTGTWRGATGQDAGLAVRRVARDASPVFLPEALRAGPGPASGRRPAGIRSLRAAGGGPPIRPGADAGPAASRCGLRGAAPRRRAPRAPGEGPSAAVPRRGRSGFLGVGSGTAPRSAGGQPGAGRFGGVSGVDGEVEAGAPARGGVAALLAAGEATAQDIGHHAGGVRGGGDDADFGVTGRRKGFRLVAVQGGTVLSSGTRPADGSPPDRFPIRPPYVRPCRGRTAREAGEAGEAGERGSGGAGKRHARACSGSTVKGRGSHPARRLGTRHFVGATAATPRGQADRS